MPILDLQSVLEDIFTIVFAAIFIPFVLLFAGIMLFGTLAVFLITAWDIFSRPDLRIGKLLWFLAVLFVPIIGAVIYWLTKPTDYDPDVALAVSRRVQESESSTAAARSAVASAQSSLGPEREPVID